MPIHTVEEMMSLKSQFPQKPFANFSIAGCIARKKQGDLLERGADAWGGRHATTVLEGHRRQIQHSLNKLSEEKYEEVLTELMKPEFFEPETIKVLVSSVFQKALSEPFLASLYANLCFSLARYEITGAVAEAVAASPLGGGGSEPPSGHPSPGGAAADGSQPGSTTARNQPGSFAAAAALGASSTSATPGSVNAAATPGQTPGSIRPKSLFRAVIVSHAQTEFEKKNVSASPTPASNARAAAASAFPSSPASPAVAPPFSTGSTPSASTTTASAAKTTTPGVIFSSPASPSAGLDEELDAEEAERALKRKRANIKFVGHLFLVNVLSFNIMRRIIDFILRVRETPMYVPEEGDLDILTVLLTTIGARIDQGTDSEARAFQDEVMTRISLLEQLGTNSLSGKPRFTMRTRTRVMDLMDLRARGWIKKALGGGPATGSNPNSASVTPGSMCSPSTPGMSRRFGSSGGGSHGGSGSQGGSGVADPRSQVFPDAPANVSTPTAQQAPPSFKSALMGGGKGRQQQQPSTSTPVEQLSVGGTGSYRPPAGSSKAHAAASSSSSNSNSKAAAEKDNTSSSNTNNKKESSSSSASASTSASASASASSSSADTAATSAPAAAKPTRPLGRMIQDTFREWLCSHSMLRSWQSRFAGYGLTDEELRAAIVAELMWDACMTTRQDAQLEVILFLKQGLSFSHIDFYPGFLKLLKRALAEGVLTDVPKFFDRLVTAMHYAAVQQLNNNNSSSTGGGGQAVRTNRTALYRQLSQLIFAAAESNPFDDDSADSNEELCDNLLRLWQAAPRDEAVEDSVVDFMLRTRECSRKFPEMVAEMLIFSITSASVLSAEPVKRWLQAADNKDSPLFSLLSKNF